jgi:Bacterial Ig-like domain
MQDKLIVAVGLLAIFGIGCGSQSTNSSPSPLAIVSIDPINGAVGVPLSECPTVDSSGNPVGHCGGTVKVTLNRPVETVTVGVYIKVLGASDLVAGTVECVTPAGGTKYALCGVGVTASPFMLFVTNTNLMPGTLYQVTLSPSIGYSNLTDINGNSLTGLPIVWLFTTTV